MADYLTRFRDKVQAYQTEVGRMNDIISSSLSRMEVTIERTKEAIPVIFINSDREGLDDVVMYSYKDDGVQKGDYIYAFDSYYLVYDEIKNVKREDYIDAFRLANCNAEYTRDSVSTKIHFRGLMKARYGVKEEYLQQHFGFDLKLDALMIYPTDTLKTDEDVKIGGKTWRVVYIDDITNAGISYVGLQSIATLQMDKQVEEENVDPSGRPALPTLMRGIEYDFSTEKGYIKFSTSVEIIKRSSNSVRAKIPFGIDTLTVEYKENGETIEKIYTVR